MRRGGLILAGGTGQRMGGIDKATLRLAGRRLVDRVAERLMPQCEAMAISANGAPERFAPLDSTVLPDPPPGDQGPLAGVLAGLEWAAECRFSHLLTAAVDTPFLPADLGDRLGSEFALAADTDGRVHGAMGLWPVSVRSKLADALASGRRKVQEVARELGAEVRVAGSDADFANVNRPEDLALAAQRLSVPFDHILMLDWSASAVRGPKKPKADAIWLGEAGEEPVYFRTRHDAEGLLIERMQSSLEAGERFLLGCDFAFGYAEGLAPALTGKADARAVMGWLAERIEDASDNANNRFEVASAMNRILPGEGPFWGHPAGREYDGLSPTKPGSMAFPERRRVEQVLRSAHPPWKLFTTGAVGSQVLMGLPMLFRLKARFGKDLALWPFEPWETAPLVVAEIYPSLIDPVVREAEGIKDAAQVRLMADGLARLQADGDLTRVLSDYPIAPWLWEEGWIVGAHHRDLLVEAARHAD